MTNKEIWKLKETVPQKKARLMARGMTAAEADEVIRYDEAVEKGTTDEYAFTPEQEAYSKQLRRCAREVKEDNKKKKGPTAYKFTQRARKENATKGGLIAAFAAFLQDNPDFAIMDIDVTNKERQIAFRIGEDRFELTLTQKRKPKN